MSKSTALVPVKLSRFERFKERLLAARARRNASLDEQGHEKLDGTPHALLEPDYETLQQKLLRFSHGEIQAELAKRGLETFEDSEDFGPDDEDRPGDYGFESDFDALQSANRRLAEAQDKVNKQREAYRQQLADFEKARQNRQDGRTRDLIEEEPSTRPPSPKRPHEAGEGEGGDPA